MDDQIYEKIEMRNRVSVFRDRADAGNVLVKMMKHYGGDNALVLAIPAGGIPVAVPLAENLGLPLDLAVASKITLPWNTESGYGAVAFDGTVILNEKMIPALGLTDDDIRRGIERTTLKVMSRIKKLRGNAPLADLKAREVILIDDGLASGITMEATAKAVRKAGARKVIVAVPTAHLESVKRIMEDTDEIYCPNIRSGWSYAVADAYESWYDVSEEEAFVLLSKSSSFHLLDHLNKGR